MLSIASIIPCHNRRRLTLSCVDNLLKIPKKGFNHIIYVVEDGSTDGTGDALQNKFGDKVVLLKGNGNLFWTGAVNMGARKAVMDGCDCVHIMNDDIEFKPNFLQELVNEFKNNRNAVVASITCGVQKRSTVVRGGILLAKAKKFPWLEIKNRDIKEKLFQTIYKVDAVSARSVLVPAALFQKIGYFDQYRFPHGFADFDFFFRVRKTDYQVIVNPASIIFTEIEPKFKQRLVNPTRLKAITDLWFDKKYFAVITFWRLFRSIEGRGYYIVKVCLKKLKWTILTLIYSKKKLISALEKYEI